MSRTAEIFFTVSRGNPATTSTTQDYFREFGRDQVSDVQARREEGRLWGERPGWLWATSLVAITLQDVVSAIPARRRGVHWLLSNAGRESNWLGKWNFCTADRHVRFDPERFGWPWFPMRSVARAYPRERPISWQF